MPYRPNKPCNYPRCRNLSIKGKAYCIDHDHLNTDKFKNKRFESHKWYALGTWKKLRLMKLKSNPLCEDCERNGRHISGYAIDHIIPWKTGKSEDEKWRLFTDFDNLQTLCDSCHQSKTGKENKS